MKMPQVNDLRGAPMGRRSYHGPRDTVGLFRLQRVYLNAGGYDNGGAYWGIGAPLYWYSDDGNLVGYLRARDRSDAKRQILETYPNARFFR